MKMRVTYFVLEIKRRFIRYEARARRTLTYVLPYLQVIAALLTLLTTTKALGWW